MGNNDQSPRLVTIPADIAPDRADKVMAEVLPGGMTRSSISRLIREGRVFVRGRKVRPSAILAPGDKVEILPGREAWRGAAPTEQPSFNILFEDDHIVVVDKPPGLVVHPGSGRSSGTLMDALLQTRPQMKGVGEPDRWGIVHRLDRDTSGVMVVAKTAAAHAELSARFKTHSIHRIYIALVRGGPGNDEGTIDIPIGRHLHDRKRISTSTAKPRSATTRWKVIARYGALTLLEVAPQTGRTHQIRVHLAAAGMPVVGDRVYGRLRGKSQTVEPLVRQVSGLLNRQALHARTLGLRHPATGEHLEFSAGLPPDMAEAVELCEREALSC